MKFSFIGLLALSACCFTIGLSADDIVDKSTGQTFPREVTIDAGGKKYDLQATGVATRKKLIIKVYSIASYLQKGTASAGNALQAILSDDNAKQLTMKWVRDVNANQVREAYEESFHRVFPGQQYAELQSVIGNFMQFFGQPAKKGDEYILRWLPGGTVEVVINGQSAGTLSNPAFAKGLWQVWFGDKSIVDRNDLLSQVR